MFKDEVIQKLKKLPLQFSPSSQLIKDPSFQKLLILIVLSSLMTFLLIPPFYFSPFKYTVGMSLETDIRADHDFLVEDKVSTERIKLESYHAIGPVFDYDRDRPASLGIKLAKAFAGVEENYYSTGSAQKITPNIPLKPEISDTIKKEFEQIAGVSLSDKELEILNRNEFDFTMCNNIVQLLYSAYKTDLIGHEEFLRINKQYKNIIVRDTKTKKEEERNNLISILDINDLETQLDKPSQIIYGKDNEDLRNTAISIILKLARPNLTFNKNLTEKHRNSILDQIKPVFYKVKKNELIARAGEPLTENEIMKIEALFSSDEGGFLKRTIGIFLTTLLLIILFHQIFRSLVKNREDLIKDIIFISFVLLIQTILIKAGIFISESISQAFPFLLPEMIYFALPFAVSTLLTAVFLHRYISFVYAIFSSILITFLFSSKLPMFLFSFLGSAISAYHITYFKQRSAFFKSGLITAAVNAIVIVCISLLTGNVEISNMLIRIMMGIAGGLLSGMIVAGITPIFESLFSYTTDIKLLELSNLNQPLLQRLILEAPGTYHHSIIVSTMVEAAAESIKANSLLAKVSAYYHDIGKLNKPLYFIENQQGWKNKHDKLSPKMSSLVIISHVKDGCELAQKYKLGKSITDIIRQHHGMGIVGYFYEKAQNDKDPSIRSIPESDFRYPGPKPQTKEAGLVLLGDVIEASSRTLSDPTPSRIRNLVQNRVKQIFMDGQLDECELTIHDVNNISESFVRTLTGIFHQRIEYAESAFKHARKEKYNGHSDHKSSEKNQVRF
jgi:hypothetical protein